jgi:D-alanyl-D-alanine carboxypeptidase
VAHDGTAPLGRQDGRIAEADRIGRSCQTELNEAVSLRVQAPCLCKRRLYGATQRRIERALRGSRKRSSGAGDAMAGKHVADSSKTTGRTSAAIRVNGDLRSTPSDLPTKALFPIYSITKTLTAICVLRLVESGSLHLGDPVRHWLPEVNVPATITLEHLLRHRGGLRDYGPLPEYHHAVRTHPDRPWTRQQFLDAVLPQGVLCAPGERFSYSNVGYMLLVDVVERATGQTFARVIHRLIATPLALQRTSVVEEIGDLVQCVAGFGPELTADGQAVDVRGRYHPGWCAPRVVASTPEDITRVFDALIAGDLLAADTLTQMLTLVALSSESDESIGVGLGLYCDQASRWGRNYHHGGGGPGYDLAATVYPATPLGRVSIAVFVNTSCGPSASNPEARSMLTMNRLLEQLLA